MSFIIKGDICYSKSKDDLVTVKDGYLICEDGHSKGVYTTIPEGCDGLPVYDYSGKLILPGLVDLHVHAPQYSYRGLGMDLELLDWLNTYTFPEESKYSDSAYVERMYPRFVDAIRRGPNTRSIVFSTLHTEGTLRLMEMFESAGLVSYVGKVNMDRNGAPMLQEASARKSLADTEAWFKEAAERFENTMPILTPRFVPSCTDELMAGLGELQVKYGLPVQSHLSESLSEVEWVKALSPDSKNYGEAYDRFGLFGGAEKPCVMAHCIWSDAAEQQLMKDNGVFIAHCPNSNMNLTSGIAPIRHYLETGQRVGLGSDVAGGTHLSIFRAMADAVQCSKLYFRLVNGEDKPLSAREVFYLGTAGGGEFFGKVGSFEPGYECDVIVIDDGYLDPDQRWSIEQRLERAIYLSKDEDVKHKFVRGAQLF